jgi:hypothetical protein
MSDYEKYLGLQHEMNRLRSRHGVTALDQPEYQAAWRASEIIKNRHGGLPPKRDSAPIAPLQTVGAFQ